MMQCIEQGNITAVFAIAKGKTGVGTERAISRTQKQKMENTHKALVGQPHSAEPIDESRWIFPEINLVPEKDPDREWETYHVDGSFYGDGLYKHAMGFAVLRDGDNYMTCGPVIPSLDGTPCAYTAEVWCLVEVLERSTKNLDVHGDCESVEMVKNLHLHSKNDFENVSHASWWRRIHHLSWGTGRELTYTHTPAHCGHYENEIVDKGAKFAARHLMKTHKISFPAEGWAQVTNDDAFMRKIEEEFLLDTHMKSTRHFPKEETFTTPHPEERQPKLRSRPLREITRERVANAIQRLSDTSAGEDGIFTKTYLREELIDDLTLLLQVC